MAIFFLVGQAQSTNMVTYRLPSYGIFSTSLQPQYWFGIPRNTSFSGLSMDVDRVTFHGAAKDNSKATRVNFTQASGARLSAMEHLVPEQMFSTPESPAHGISAVKALALAAAEGQKIWTITQDNLELALSSINLSAEVESEIRNSVLAGQIATAHEAQLNYFGWVGSGYLLIDPETGAGAYKIAGGSNGGVLVAVVWILVGIWTVLATSLVLIGLFAGLAIAIETIAIVYSFISAIRLIKDIQAKCDGVRYVAAAIAATVYSALGLVVPPFITAIMAAVEHELPAPSGC